MKKITLFFGILAVAAIFSSCSVTMPLSVSEAPIGLKSGKSSNFMLFGISFNKNFGIAEAAKNGAIQKGVATVDLQTTTYFIHRGVASKQTIIVQGN